MGEEKPVESTEEKEEEEKPAESTEDEEKEEEEKPAESTEDEEEEEEEKPEESTKEEEKKEDEKEKPAESTKEEEKKEEHKEKPAESTEEEEKKEEEKEKPAESTEEEEKKEDLHVPRVGCGGNITEETGKESGCGGNNAEETAEGKEGEEEADELQYVKFGSREDVNFDTSVCKKYTVGPEMNADMIKAEEWFSKFTEQCHNGSIAENVYDDINDSTSTATDAKKNGGQIEFFVGDEAVSLESLEK